MRTSDPRIVANYIGKANEQLSRVADILTSAAEVYEQIGSVEVLKDPTFRGVLEQLTEVLARVGAAHARLDPQSAPSQKLPIALDPSLREVDVISAIKNCCDGLLSEKMRQELPAGLADNLQQLVALSQKAISGVDPKVKVFTAGSVASRLATLGELLDKVFADTTTLEKNGQTELLHVAAETWQRVSQK